MKLKLTMIVLVLALVINLVIIVTPLYSLMSEGGGCDKVSSTCPNNGGPLCATVTEGNITWYCYYGS